MKLAGLFIVAALFLCSCAAVSVKSAPDIKSVIIESAPFYPQDEFQCGPASLAAVLNYWGSKTTSDEIAAEIYSKSAKGSLNIDLQLYAAKKGLFALSYKGDWDDIKAKIEGGYPLIVLVDYGFSIFRADHFMVIIGYNEGGVFVNSGKKMRLFIDKEDFIMSWQKTNYWTLWIKRGRLETR